MGLINRAFFGKWNYYLSQAFGTLAAWLSL